MNVMAGCTAGMSALVRSSIHPSACAVIVAGWGGFTIGSERVSPSEIRFVCLRDLGVFSELDDLNHLNDVAPQSGDMSFFGNKELFRRLQT
jgi:hypothetical protein